MRRDERFMQRELLDRQGTLVGHLSAIRFVGGDCGWRLAGTSGEPLGLINCVGDLIDERATWGWWDAAGDRYQIWTYCDETPEHELARLYYLARHNSELICR